MTYHIKLTSSSALTLCGLATRPKGLIVASGYRLKGIGNDKAVVTKRKGTCPQCRLCAGLDAEATS